jgi:hypothetical protein
VVPGQKPYFHRKNAGFAAHGEDAQKIQVVDMSGTTGVMIRLVRGQRLMPERAVA